MGRGLGPWLLLACATPGFADTIPLSVVAADDPSRWTASLEAVAFRRSDTAGYVLVSRLPGATTTFGQTQDLVGTEAFNSRQFDRGYAAGPRLTIAYRADTQRRFELSYLAILNLEARRTIGPDDPVNWYVMRAPGFWQTQDFQYQGMTWASTAALHSLEATALFQVSQDLALFAGARWLRLKDSLTGSLTPTDTHEPSWKLGSCATDGSSAAASVAGMTLPGTAQSCAAGGAVNGYPAFWNTGTTNDLLGLQAGMEGTFFAMGPFTLRGVAKAGVYGNRAQQDAAVSLQKQMYYAGATRNRLAFAGEAAIQAEYRLSANLSATLGYELLWLDRVALAPGQIDLTVSTARPTSVNGTGVDTGASVLLQGFTAGFEYAF